MKEIDPVILKMYICLKEGEAKVSNMKQKAQNRSDCIGSLVRTCCQVVLSTGWHQ